MSLYHMINNGPHPLASLWLGVLDVHPKEIERLRDAFLVRADGELRIYVLARSDDNPELHDHPWLAEDRVSYPGDTYHEWEFKPVDELTRHLEVLEPVATRERFAVQLDMVQNNTAPAEVQTDLDEDTLNAAVNSIIAWLNEREEAKEKQS